MSSQTIDVVVSFDKGYLLPARVLLASTAYSAAADARVRFHVISTDLSPADRTAVGGSVRSIDEVHYYDTERLTAGLNAQVIASGLKDPGQLRFWMSGLPENVHRVIYLDTDIVVTGDIGALWAMDLQGHYVGAVEDRFVGAYGRNLLSTARGLLAAGDRRMLAHRNRTTPKRSKYFNSGVLLIDLDAWRRERISERCVSFAAGTSPAPTYADQDALNIVFLDDWYAIPASWNCILPQFSTAVLAPEEISEMIAAAELLHFAGSPKPWSEDYPEGEISDLYARATRTMADRAGGGVGAYSDA